MFNTLKTPKEPYMGISGLLSTVSLLGFLLFLLGIALVVVAASQGRAVRGGVGLAIFGLIFGVVMSIVSGGILVVDPTQVAVITNTLNGQLETPARGPGTSIIIPGLQQATLYNTRQQEYTMSESSGEGARPNDDAVEATTVDGQQVRVDVTVIYSLDRTKVNDTHVRWGKDGNGQDAYIEGFLRPTARTVVRDIIATLRAENIYGAQRNEMQLAIEAAMTDEMANEGLILSSFLVRGLQFSDEFTTAIEDKEIAQQRTEQSLQEAERARTIAQGERDARILRAEGERDAAIALAEGQAQALALVSEQISANPSLIQYEYVRNLSDNVQLILVPSNGPFLFDFNSLTGGALNTLPGGNAGGEDETTTPPTTTP
jgi:regulator of protease activity HflC (stomatin/prohibitin superfamily)